VAAAGFVLAGAAPTFPRGTVHLAVVDPGVGSPRRMLAVEASFALARQIFVAPDNGLLTPVLQGARVHAVDRPDLYLDAPGATFHGRDRFAPIVAAILRGTVLEDLGPRIDDAIELATRPPRRDDSRGTLHGHIVYVDRYGNLITDVPATWLRGTLLSARAGDTEVRRVATHYAEIEAGVPALLVGSLGTLEIAMRDQSAARATGIQRGDAITIEISPDRR